MKYTVLDRGDDVSRLLAASFHQLAIEQGLQRDDDAPDIVVSIGGDGTMLHAFHMYLHLVDHISFVGVHTGHLGFYADWNKDEIVPLVKSIASCTKETMSSVSYPLLQVDIVKGDKSETYYALNEFTIRGDDGKTLVANIKVNGESFEMFRGDGICISTPSGSTAYNKALGGAMLHPTIEAIQMTEIASINNRVFRTLGSPMILPKHHYCEIIPRSDQKLLLSIDHLNVQPAGITLIRSRVARSKVKFARYRPYPFWNRVRSSFIGDMD